MDDPADTCTVASALVALTERAVPDVDAMYTRLRATGMKKDRVKGIIRAIEPWAPALRRAA
jgi:hypothetical protein